MKKKYIVGLLAAGIVVGLLGVVVISQTDSENLNQQTESVSESTTPAPTLNPLGVDARYQPFTPEYVAQTADTRRVLFFYANWCPTCRPADADFVTRITEIPEDVTVIRVNYKDPDTDEQESALAEQYGVTYQHTFVQINANGEEVTKWNGGSVDELLENIQ